MNKGIAGCAHEFDECDIHRWPTAYDATVLLLHAQGSAFYFSGSAIFLGFSIVFGRDVFCVQ